MEFEERRYRLTGISPLLGSIALDKQDYEKYIASKVKASKNKTAEDYKMALQDSAQVFESEDPEDLENQRVATGFYRDVETRNLILKDYQIKGFFKEAARALKDQIGVLYTTSKIDNFVFISERNIHIMRNGEWVNNPDSVLERPLRASTPQGMRVALAYSEMLDDPWYVEITIKVLKNNKTEKSKNLTIDTIEELLSYGEYKGLLQWRNAGYGSFTFERLED